ncbi:hypothetical protein BDV18DRAFT_57624 [Aspergillus unguis]
MAASQVQTLLRFLSQDAKVPLATAMGKVNELIKADLSTPENVSKAELKLLQEIFKDSKIAKQVHNAAKRVSKKRGAPAESSELSPQKKPKPSFRAITTTPFEAENALALSVSNANEEELSKIVLLTNRAPLVLAFAVCVLRYTMPEQPVSSRLSLAQALVSANSRSKAVSLGIEQGNPAEQEGWGDGQPTVSILGRDIKVLKRWDYDPREGEPAQDSQKTKTSSDDVLGQRPPDSEPVVPLWGIDTEALKHASHADNTPNANKTLPIHTAQSARSYLLRSFLPSDDQKNVVSSSPKKKNRTQLEADKEAYLGHLLRSIELVCQSWASTLSVKELDRRAWSWYVSVRPAVQSGPEGWGERGAVNLSEILALRRQP